MGSFLKHRIFLSDRGSHLGTRVPNAFLSTMSTPHRCHLNITLESHEMSRIRYHIRMTSTTCYGPHQRVYHKCVVTSSSYNKCAPKLEKFWAAWQAPHPKLHLTHWPHTHKPQLCAPPTTNLPSIQDVLDE